jgi:hypothetical protein
MTVRLAVSIALALSLPGCSSSSPPTQYYRPTPSQAVKASEEAVDTPAWLRQADYRHGGPIPPMEDKRKINEQSCTTGVQLDAGNLRCK